MCNRGTKHKEIQYPGWHKDSTGKGLQSRVDDDCEVEKIMRFLRKIGMFEEI